MQPRRAIAVVGLLAAIAFVLFTSSPKQAPPEQSPVAAVATPGVTIPASPSPLTPGVEPRTNTTVPFTPAPTTTSPGLPSVPTVPTAPGVGPSAPSPLPMPSAPGAVIPTVRTAPPNVEPADVDLIALENDLQHVQMMVRDYRTAVGENPFGTNAEIMQSVLGDNLKQAKIGAPEGQNLNEKGELVDRWGTPYFFHQVSKTEMEIRSAGPDRVMWNGDDRELK